MMNYWAQIKSMGHMIELEKHGGAISEPPNYQLCGRTTKRGIYGGHDDDGEWTAKKEEGLG